ncbi:MAG: septal ring lytic transglycosylase RlpA family protein [Solirubrobacteraceae bacterium]
MLRRANTYLITAGATAALLFLPSLGTADSGGGGIAPKGSQQAQPGNRTVSASAHGMTITTHASGFLRRTLTFTGWAGRHAAGKTVEIDRKAHQTGEKWVLTTRGRVNSDGSFTARWRSHHSGSFAIRAVLGSAGSRTAGGGASFNAQRDSSSSWPTVKVIIYKMAIATIFGSGFWGSRTACGEILHRNTMGVANRTLPCGTPISIYWHGRTIQVPVIDRGPYANHADWDLTEATARALHINSTETVGAAALPRR